MESMAPRFRVYDTIAREEKSMVSKVARAELIKRRKTVSYSDVHGYDGSKKRYFFTVIVGSTGLSYLCIALSDLLSGSTGFTLNDLKFDKVPFGPMIHVKDSRSLYLIGGDGYGDDSLDHVVSTDVTRFDIYSSGLVRSCKRSPMISKKMMPVILVHQNIVYILSSWGWVDDVGNSNGWFESYNTSTDKWDRLPSPPFFDEESQYYYPSLWCLSYVFFDNKICVSVQNYLAFAYDIEKREWDFCHLFNHYEGYFTSDFNISEWRYFIRNKCAPCPLFNGSHDNLAGQPFPFSHRAISVDNKYLIATELPRAVAVVYAIFDGKVEKTQLLFNFYVEFHECDSFEPLFALGEDLYCLGFCRKFVDSTWLTLLIFRASPKEDSEGSGSDEFFAYQFLRICTIKTEGGSIPVLPFVMDEKTLDGGWSPDVDIGADSSESKVDSMIS